MNRCTPSATGRVRPRRLPAVIGMVFALGATAAHSQALDLSLHPTMGHTAPAANQLAVPASAPAPAAPVPVLAPPVSSELQAVEDWIFTTHDNAGMPYLLIDKVGARVYVFHPDGRLRGTAPALLGMTRGDQLKVSNETQMEQMGPEDRVTPAGRFVARLAIDSHGKELLVIDYDASISLHAVVKGTPEERRAERLGSPTPDDNRISFGCINVPTDFYANVVSTTFAGRKGVVYILPETEPASQLFAMQPPPAPASGAPSALDAPASNQ